MALMSSIFGADHRPPGGFDSSVLISRATLSISMFDRYSWLYHVSTAEGKILFRATALGEPIPGPCCELDMELSASFP